MVKINLFNKEAKYDVLIAIEKKCFILDLYSLDLGSGWSIANEWNLGYQQR